jgi:pyrimidine-nucleoside phosphorylase
MLGGGREKKEDKIDHAVGLEFHKRIGDRVGKGEKLVTIHYNGDAKVAEAKSLIASSYVVNESAPPEKRPLVRRIIGA